MLQLIGRSAFSAFRLDKLLASVQASVKGVLAIRSEYRYFVEVEGGSELKLAEQSILETLLEADFSTAEIADNESFFLAKPRPFTYFILCI